MNQAFSKIWIPIILVALIAAGIFAWQYFEAPKEEISQDKTVDWQTYRNEEFGFEVKYPNNWSIGLSGTGYDASAPFILLWFGAVSDEPCQGLGCPPRSGDRDELIKGTTFEGAPPLNPWFKLLRVRGATWVSIQVTDTLTNCQSYDFCQEYLKKAPLAQKAKINIPGYQTYNDFIDILSNFKFIE